jgi:hypothetical protein
MSKQIRVINFKKFNPRADVKQSSWFRLEHGIFSHPDWDDFTTEELMVWFSIVAQASSLNKDTFAYRPDRLAAAARIMKRPDWETIVESAVEKLKAFKCIEIAERARDVPVTPTIRERSPTRRDDTIRNEEEEEGGAHVADDGKSEPPGDGGEIRRGAIAELEGEPEVERMLAPVDHATQCIWLKAYGDAAWIRTEILKSIPKWTLRKKKHRKDPAGFLGSWLSIADQDRKKSKSGGRAGPEMAGILSRLF